jgi:hypothetical protein
MQMITQRVARLRHGQGNAQVSDVNALTRINIA